METSPHSSTDDAMVAQRGRDVPAPETMVAQRGRDVPAPERLPLLTDIAICMGSSCFSRGNNRNLTVIQNHLAAHPLPAGLELRGHLCEGHCTRGPNVTINGKIYHEVDPIVIIGLLNHFAQAGK